MQTGQGCRRQATFIVSNCCNECQDQKTKLNAADAWRSMVWKKKYSLRCLQKTMRKVGNALKAAQLMQNSVSSRVRQGLSEYNPFLQIQKYQSESAGRLTEQWRMRCQESVNNTWLSTSFTLCASSARCQHRARNHLAPRQRASGCHST